VTGNSDVMDAPHVGGLGGTFGGNPVACAAALAVIAELTETDLLERGRRQGEVIRQRLDPLVDELELVGEVRGLGPMVGIELVTDKQTKEPAKAQASEVVRRCHEKGVLILKAGTYDNVVRLLAPLVITDSDLNEGLDVLIESIRSAE
jgi:4-aminobutyrate aminotransferase/(S)-3-amino-2-methylpropionate transaminase